MNALKEIKKWLKKNINSRNKHQRANTALGEQKTGLNALQTTEQQPFGGIKSGYLTEEIKNLPCEYEEVKPCEHRSVFLAVINTCCTIEVTALFCKDYGEQLTDERWEA